MIIRYPSGLYTSVLPKKPSDGGNVTFLISSTDPPRSLLQFLQIPIGISHRTRDELVYTKQERRGTLGELVFSISKSNASVVGSGKKQYEVGEVLEFDTTAQISVTPMLVPEITQIRHDTNLLDYSGLGISADELLNIERAAQSAMNRLETELNAARQNRSNAEVDISKNQKSINETIKAISALETLSEIDGSVVPVIDKLRSNLIDLENTKSLLMSQADSYAVEASQIVDKMRKLTQVVR